MAKGSKKPGSREKRDYRQATGGASAPYPIDHDRSKSHFTHHGQKMHEKNLPSRLPMRGGIRL